MAAKRVNLSGKHVVITGASSGLGAALALEMAGHGARVALLARRQELLDAVAGKIASRGGEAIALATDVRVEESVAAAVAQAVEQWGPVDILVANAGVSPNMAAAEVDVSLVEDTMQLNFFGVVYPMNAVLSSMIERQDGIVLAISSVAAFRGLPTAAPYCSSKAAVSAWMESLRSELDLRNSGVRLVTSHPGFINTPMTSGEEFEKPFMIEADDAARRLVQGLFSGASEINFPWQLVAMMKFANWLPNRLYDRLVWGSVTNPVTWGTAVRDASLWVAGWVTACLVAVFSTRLVSTEMAQNLLSVCRIAAPLLWIVMLYLSQRIRGTVKVPILIVLFSIPLAVIAAVIRLPEFF